MQQPLIIAGIPQAADAPRAVAAPSADHLCLLDAGRGLAALAVVMLHYYHFLFRFPQNTLDPRWAAFEPGFGVLWPLYQYGVYAVNAFWMISGFVFARVYCGAGATTRSFVVNRVARLYPLHVLTLLVIAALQALAFRRLGFHPIYGFNDWPRFLEHLSFTSAWGYDSHSAFNAPIWSVSAEIVVYALFWLAAGWLHRKGPVAALILAACAGLLLLTGSHNLVAACAYFFFAGAALALAMRSWSRGQWRVAVAALALAALLFLSSSRPVVWNALGLPSLFGALVLLLAGLEPVAGARLRALGLWIGDTTYGTYLWHVPMQVALIIALHGRVDIMALAARPAFLLAWLVAVLLVARISLVLYERPMRRWIRDRFA
ncbi:MAG: acyltransferase [Sphingomonadales bacterium]|nr:acyltransferase [Sphingomonadales bacterium]